MVDFKWTWHLDGGWWQGIRVHSEFLNTVGVLGHAGVVYRVYDMRYIYNVYPHQSPSAPYCCSLSFSLFHLFPPIPSRETYPHRHHHLHHHQLLGFLPSHPKKNQILNPFHLIESHILSREIRLNFRNKNESSLLFYSHTINHGI